MFAATRKSVLCTGIALALVGSAFAGNGNNNSVRVMIEMQPGTRGNVERAVGNAGGQVHHRFDDLNVIAISVPAQALNGLSHNPNVISIEEDVIRTPLAAGPGDTASTGNPYALGQVVPWGIKAVQADQLPNGDMYAGNRKVCIIDSGYDRAHEDLSKSANITGEYDSGTGWWYTDENHHGTHVAGTISALNNGVGVVGVNSNDKLKLHIVKVFSATGWAYSSSLITAANKCKAAGANVISMSLGGGARSKTEERAFASLASAGILSIAAAGNDGNTVMSYPASYASVMSVASAALDSSKPSGYAWSDFSQYNSAVDIAGPGSSVYSTVPMGGGSESLLSVGGTSYNAGDMSGSLKSSVTAPLADFGLGTSAVAGSMTGKVCLIQRGTVDFNTKVTNCKNSGGVGAVVYNNVAGGFGGTMGDGVTSTIPAVTASDTDGAAMKNQLGQSATVTVRATSYSHYDGTSMATPHVSAVAALVWSYYPNCTGNQIKASLEKSAKDMETAGRDNKSGYGMVQALAAYNRIRTNGCGL